MNKLDYLFPLRLITAYEHEHDFVLLSKSLVFRVTVLQPKFKKV